MKYVLVLTAFLFAGICNINAQEIGLNFNHNPEFIDLNVTSKLSKAQWIRTTPFIFEYIDGKKDPATAPGLQNVIDAKTKGYNVAFGFRWDFRKYELSIPVPNSETEKKYFNTVLKILNRVGPYIDIFKLGNEPNLETMEADLQVSSNGSVPLVVFTERLLTQVVLPYYASNPTLKRPDIYVGSLPRLFLKSDQVKPGVIGLIKMAEQNANIKGLSVHLHISDSTEMDKAFTFVRSIMPSKPIIIPEFSLFRLYNSHMGDKIGDSEKGIAFAKKYAYNPSMKLYDWYSKVNTELVDSAQWNDFFASRKWFPQHFLQTYYRYFQKYGVILATYGFVGQSSPKKVTKQTPSWFINAIYPIKTLKSQSDGSFTPNPLWHDDFVDIVNKGNSWKKSQNK